MRVLAIDTATMIASVAVVDSERGVLAEGDSDVNTHSERLVALIESALSDAGTELAALDAIAVGAGPGSFTGLRIGMATAKGLCFATGKPLWAVSSLAALAAGSGHQGVVVPVMDAKRSEIFAGFYRVGESSAQSLAPERVLAPDLLADALAEIGIADPVICGDGAVRYREAARAAGSIADDARPTPKAAAVGKLAISGDRVDVAQSATPVYIRLSEAEIRFPDGNPGGAFRPKGS
jgi:tRNA threonylcarbamoyladenosine biosynthesis protein TsaB